jgi:CRP-like cAMP-binding protein
VEKSGSNPVVLATLSEKELFGEITFIDSKRQCCASIIAETDSYVLQLEGEKISQLMEVNVTIKLYNYIALLLTERICAANDKKVGRSEEDTRRKADEKQQLLKSFGITVSEQIVAGHCT